jgi:hypothetical protein
MDNRKPQTFTVISPLGEILVSSQTGLVLTTFKLNHPLYNIIGFNIEEFKLTYGSDLPATINMRDLGYAEASDTGEPEVYEADPTWRLNRSNLTRAAKNPDVQIIQSEYGPEIICSSARYNSQLDTYWCGCEACLSSNPPADEYTIIYDQGQYEGIHKWPEWGS